MAIGTAITTDHTASLSPFRSTRTQFVRAFLITAKNRVARSLADQSGTDVLLSSSLPPQPFKLQTLAVQLILISAPLLLLPLTLVFLTLELIADQGART